MSPEQAGSGGDVDTRADVYSLGVLLYELLCGERPFSDEEPRSAGLAGMQRMLRELDRFLGGQTVLAGPPDLSYRVRKFARRHRVALSFAAVVLLLVVGGGVAAGTQAVRAQRAEREAQGETRRARTERAKFEELAELLRDVLLGVDPAVAQGKDPELLLAVLERAGRRLLAGERVDEALDALHAAFEVLDLAAVPPWRARAIENLFELHEAHGELEEAAAWRGLARE